MGILIGMDEAGYGPNFGPLVVAATAWHVREGSGFRLQDSANGSVELASGKTNRKKSAKSDASTRDAPIAIADPKPIAGRRQPIADHLDLYRLLRPTVSKTPSDRRIAIADSKLLYTPGLGLRQLERGLHSVLRSMCQVLSCWSELIEYCAADPDGHHKRTCWPDGHNCALPLDAASDELLRLEPRFTRACESAQIRPLFIRARLVFPAEFNDLVDHYGTKGAALSHVTVGLLREVIDKVDHLPQSLVPSPQPPTHVVCDKHGGRNFYTALLQHHFSEHWIEPVYESHTESRYEWGAPESRICASFRMQGERFLPTALASMTAKYLRELSMRAFNTFWCAHVADLRPTAGYPKDSHRFRKDIRAAQRKLGIEDHVLWRNR
jgi:ribonuclease HII